MDIESKMDLVRQVGEEIVTEEELKSLFETKQRPIAYDGFEPSGTAHIAQGILRAINVNKMTKAGIHFKMYAADWHAWTNLKFGGDLEKIQVAGDYLIEIWKASGMDMDKSKVTFIRATDVVDNQDYWKKVMRIAQHSTIKRILRCGQIMGRKESEVQQASQIIYPCLQAADIFEFEADITQLGMDQRKVNMLAREVGPKLGWWKPVVVSHHMLMGLNEPPKGDKNNVDRKIEMKMSKSKPDTAIFMTDTPHDVIRKIKKAYCPANIVEENPLMDYARHILFEKFKEIKVERPAKFGGDLTFHSIHELEKTYATGNLHPMDLKNAVASHLNKLLDPVRKHFSKGKPKQLMEKVNSFKVTR